MKFIKQVIGKINILGVYYDDDKGSEIEIAEPLLEEDKRKLQRAISLGKIKPISEDVFSDKIDKLKADLQREKDTNISLADKIKAMLEDIQSMTQKDLRKKYKEE